MQLQANLQNIAATGTQVVAISYDSVEVLAQFAQKHAITFPLLSDPGSKTIDAFGLRNREAKGKAEGVPHPGTFVIDKQGIVRGKLLLENHRERHTPEELIKATKNVP